MCSEYIDDYGDGQFHGVDINGEDYRARIFDGVH